MSENSVFEKKNSYNIFFKKKVGFFQGGGGGLNVWDKLTLVFLELQKNFFFSNRSEFRQEFNGLIRKTFRPQLEAVEAVFRNFLGGWGGTFFNFFYFFSYLWYEHISISASWRHSHYFFFQKNWIFGHILFF